MGTGPSKDLVESFVDDVVFEKYKDKVTTAHLQVAVHNVNVNPIVVKRLLEAGVAVNDAIWASIEWRYVNCVTKAQWLLAYGGGNDYLKTVFLSGVINSNTISIMKMMINAGSSASGLLMHLAKNYMQIYLKNLHWERQTDMQKMLVDTIKLLLQSGANVNETDSTGMTALMYILSADIDFYYRKYEIYYYTFNIDLFVNHITSVVAIFVEYGAKIDVLDSNEQTVLYKCNIDWLFSKIVFAYKLDINHKDKLGNTLLIHYIKRYVDIVNSYSYSNFTGEFINILYILVNKGADIYIRNNDGYNALEYARIKLQHKYKDKWEKVRDILIRRKFDYDCTPPPPAVVNRSKVMGAAETSSSLPATATSQESMYKSDECVICNSRNSIVYFSPCKHLCTCVQCFDNMASSSDGIKICPMCRAAIVSSKTIQS